MGSWIGSCGKKVLVLSRCLLLIGDLWRKIISSAPAKEVGNCQCWWSLTPSSSPHTIQVKGGPSWQDLWLPVTPNYPSRLLTNTHAILNTVLSSQCHKTLPPNHDPAWPLTWSYDSWPWNINQHYCIIRKPIRVCLIVLAHSVRGQNANCEFSSST